MKISQSFLGNNILTITLVSSLKQHLIKQMQHSVYLIFSKIPYFLI